MSRGLFAPFLKSKNPKDFSWFTKLSCQSNSISPLFCDLIRQLKGGNDFDEAQE